MRQNGTSLRKRATNKTFLSITKALVPRPKVSPGVLLKTLAIRDLTPQSLEQRDGIAGMYARGSVVELETRFSSFTSGVYTL